MVFSENGLIYARVSLYSLQFASPEQAKGVKHLPASVKIGKGHCTEG